MFELRIYLFIYILPIVHQEIKQKIEVNNRLRLIANVQEYDIAHDDLFQATFG